MHILAANTRTSHGRTRWLVAMLLTTVLCGCTPCREYIHNGFKVGPNYGRPAAPVAQQWIDANDKRVNTERRRFMPVVERI